MAHTENTELTEFASRFALATIRMANASDSDAFSVKSVQSVDNKNQRITLIKLFSV